MAENIDEFADWTNDLIGLSEEIRRMKPARELSSATKGMPAVMRVLLMADGPMSP